jgi:hypothetical protein
MNIELENLIDMALADGKVTEKERAVILRKAESLGIDKDEVEMILDGKLHQLEASKPKQKEKVGNVKACPACGASVKAMTLNCSDCDHEFVSAEGNSSIKKLISEIEKINQKSNNDSESMMNTVWDTAQTHSKKNQLIEMFPIPNTKEDLIEFLTYTISKVDYSDSASGGPWTKKAKESILKSRLFFSNDKEMLMTLDLFEKEIKNNSKNSSAPLLAMIPGLALMFFICYLVYLWLK